MKLHEVKRFPWTRDNEGNVLFLGPKRDLTGSPEQVLRTFDCENSDLNSLKGGPKVVMGNFICSRNYLSSLLHAPRYIGGGFYCNDNKIKTLHNIHKIVERIGRAFVMRYNTPTYPSNMLGLCLIADIESIRTDNNKIDDIFNSVFEKTKDKSQRLLEVQDALIDAGFTEQAKL